MSQKQRGQLLGGSRPGLGDYVGRELAVGIRPEHLGSSSAANGSGRPRLSGTVSVVESLGSERLVHLVVQGEPVLTDEILEVARDTDDALAQTLTQEADDHEVPVVARMDLHTAMQAGQECEVALDPAFLHFFDLQDGHSIR